MGITGTRDTRDTENTFSLVSEVPAKTEQPSEPPGIDPYRDRDGAPLADDGFASDDDEFTDVDVSILVHPPDDAPPPAHTVFMAEDPS